MAGPTQRRPWIGTLFFGLVGFVAAALFLQRHAPPPHRVPEAAFRDYDRAPMQGEMHAAKVAARLESLAALGSRSPGQPGHRATAAWLRDRYLQAGLELIEQPLRTVHPTLLSASLRDASGQERDLALLPFFPNHVQPMASPEGGLAGQLFRVDDAALAGATRFDDKLALLDLADPPPALFGTSAARYAAAGFKALLVTHREGLERIPLADYAKLTFDLPVNFVRVAVDPGVLDLAGQPVTLDVRTAFRFPAATNLVAVLRAGQPTGEAVVVPVSYDGSSALPDQVPGSLHALQVAIQLQILEGLLPVRDLLRRDVVFVATGADFNAQDSLYQLLRAIGRPGERASHRQTLVARLDGRRQDATRAERLSALFADPAFAADRDATERGLAGLAAPDRHALDGEIRHVMRTRLLVLAEDLLQARIRFEKAGADPASEAYQAFRNAKRTHDAFNTLTSLPLPRILAGSPPGDFDLRQALRDRLRHLGEHGRREEAGAAAALAVHDLFAGYASVTVISPLLNPMGVGGQETLSFTCGGGDASVAYGEQARNFHALLSDAVQSLGLEARVRGVYHGPKRQDGLMRNLTSDVPAQARLWSRLSYPACTVVSPGADYRDYGHPYPLDIAGALPALSASLAVLGEAVLSAACGNGRFEPGPFIHLNHFQGKVLAADVGNSVVPTYPVEGALVIDREPPQGHARLRGNLPGQAPVAYRRLLVATEPDGSYDLPLCAATFASGGPYSPEAAAYGPSGEIHYYSDRGAGAQNLFKSIGISGPKLNEPIHLVQFRAAAVALLDRNNPQTFRDYGGVDFLMKRGLRAFPSHCQIAGGDGFVDFIPPDETFFVALKAGSAENERVQEIRAFMLGTPESPDLPGENEIDGQGYLAQDHPILFDRPGESARSMLSLNEKRLRLQRRHGMADAMTLRFQERAADQLQSSREPGLPAIEREDRASASVTYSTLNHPVIRTAISEAVWGILWYMGLLVPFVFFFEKLVFASTDIRKALLIQALVFLAVFGLLRLLHPAFGMIRSSLMILLGFAILLISCGITLILSGKFKENLDSLRQSQGLVKGARENTMGIVLTAFMLGLNNMHRRKVRTGLTCATLVLLTFVMICFTSVQSDIAETRKAIGKAPYQGLLVKNEGFEGIRPGEVHALERRFGRGYRVLRRQAYVGHWDMRNQRLDGPGLTLSRAESGSARQAQAATALLFDDGDPLARRLRLLAGSPLSPGPGPVPVLLSGELAEDLGLRPEDPWDPDTKVDINGRSFRIAGIFDSASLARLYDLDGDNPLPFDVEGMISPRLREGDVLAGRDAPRVDPARVILAPNDRFDAPVAAAGHLVPPRVLSVAIDMEAAGFKQAREDIDVFLEQSGEAAHFGLDGIAFLGKRARERGLAGMVDLLIPLLIAGLTVLNTMKGSVYERRDELFVYNAVGIAPRYVFFMFIAEAMVYVVIGSLLGYLLGQGTGRILGALGMTGGMNMNFTSLASVQASWTLAAAVFLSTVFPARSAMRIASPAEDAGWRLPEAEGDRMSFELPFTFTHRDRIAVLAFFHRFFSNHGEGSSGPFFAGPPTLGLSDRTDALAGDAPIPRLACMIWLKPFDLGVSQLLEIELATDPHTGEFISSIHLTRQSGTLEAWQRLNAAFVGRLRKHFLLWRAVPESWKPEWFQTAKSLLERSTSPGIPPHG